jgi:hypothetical protein
VRSVVVTFEMLKKWMKKSSPSEKERQHDVAGESALPMASGWMLKEGGHRKNWNKRFFALYSDPYRMYYWDSGKTVMYIPIGIFSHIMLAFCFANRKTGK